MTEKRTWRIPFNRPGLSGNELTYIADVLRIGHASGDGIYTKRCQTFLEHTMGVPKVLLTTSCTHALELAALLLEIKPGDEVIIPSFTFVSTANAFVLRGARLVFGDIRRDTLNLDENEVQRLVSPRTKAIIPVHYAGVGCEMDAIMEIGQRNGIPVVEDNAQGLFGRYKGQYLGTFGCCSAQSFHETKNFTCGEGGALFINESRYIERAEVIREKGTNGNHFARGEVDKYTWVDLGSSYLPSDILAAFLYGQLEGGEQIQVKRQRVWEYYYRHLEDLANKHGVRLPSVPTYCEQSYHMFYLLLPSHQKRQALIAHLKANDIRSVFHYQPLHLSKMGQLFSARPPICPITEEVSDRLVRLPFYNDLTEHDQARVVAAVRRFVLQ